MSKYLTKLLQLEQRIIDKTDRIIRLLDMDDRLILKHMAERAKGNKMQVDTPERYKVYEYIKGTSPLIASLYFEVKEDASTSTAE